MAEIIRPFGTPNLNADNAQDPRITAFKQELAKLEAHRAELLARYEETRKALEIQKQAATQLTTRAQRSEQQLALEQSRLKGAQEVIANFQRQWGQMVENDKKLRAAFAELQARAKAVDGERQALLEEKSSATAELARLKGEITNLTRAHGDLELRHRQVQETLVTLERQSDEEKHKAALLQQELDGARLALASNEQSQNALRHELSDARFRIEQLKREFEMSQLRGQELERLCQEGLQREERCRAEILRLKNELNDLAAALKFERDVLATTRTKLANSERACEQIMQDRVDLVRRGDEAYADVARLGKKLEELTAQHEKTAATLTCERDEALSNLSQLEQQVLKEREERERETEAALAELRVQVETALNEARTLRAALHETNDQLESERNAREAAIENAMRTERMHQEMLKDRAELVKRGDAAYEEIARLNRKAEESISQARQLADSYKNERDSALQVVANLEAELSNARHLQRRMEQQRIDLTCQQDALQAEIDRLQAELLGSQEAFAARDADEQRLREDLQQTQLLVQQLSEDRGRLAEENDTTLAELRSAQAALDAAREEQRIAKVEMNGIKSSLTQALGFSQQMEQDRAQLQSQLAEARRAIDRSRQELNQAALQARQTEASLTKKVQSEEATKNALWEELVEAQRALEQAQLDVTRFKSEVDFLKRTAPQQVLGGELAPQADQMARTQELLSEESQSMIAAALRLQNLSAGAPAEPARAQDPESGKRKPEAASETTLRPQDLNA